MSTESCETQSFEAGVEDRRPESGPRPDPHSNSLRSGATAGARAGHADRPAAGCRAAAMASRGASLRGAVEKWLSPDDGHPVTVAGTGRTRRGGVPYVEVRRATDALAMYFFRHGDGTWQVYPPA